MQLGELWKCVTRNNVCWQTVPQPSTSGAWRRLGLQQLHTVTGGHPADGSVMTADVAWTACQTTIGGLQPDRIVPCHAIQ